MLSVKELRTLIVGLDAKQLGQQLGPFALVLRPPEKAGDESLAFYQQRTAVADQAPDFIESVLELVLQFDDLRVATLPPLANDDELTVGRSPECDLALDHASVSKRHALLHWRSGVCSLRDADSTNGTFVNDTRLQGGRELPLRDGDVLGFGEAHFWFLLIDTLYARIKPSAPKGARARKR